MKIKLKAELEDKVYFIHNTVILQGTVKSIHLHNLGEYNETIEYEVKVELPNVEHVFSLIQSELHLTKKSLLKSFKKRLNKLN